MAAIRLEKLKSIITQKPTKLDVANVILSPEVGFRILHNSVMKELRVTIIGARHLPSIYGMNSVHGYIIKVKIFPGIQKFETEYRTESWPTYNQEFIFNLESTSNPEQQLNGKFLVLTAYAILENKNISTNNNELSSTFSDAFGKKYKRKISNFFDKKLELQQSQQNEKPKLNLNNRLKHENSMTFEKRRTIGSVTYSIQSTLFVNQTSNFSKMTDEIWKNFENLNISISPTENGDNNKIITGVKRGEIELGLLYKKSEDGEKCSFVFSLLRMRCNLQTMQQHEQLNGLLYIKSKIKIGDQVISKGRTEPFAPSISQKFDKNSTNLKGNVSIIDLENVIFLIVLMNKTRMGDKTEIGRICLSSKSKASYLAQWEKSLENSNQTITMWQPLLE